MRRGAEAEAVKLLLGSNGSLKILISEM